MKLSRRSFLATASAGPALVTLAPGVRGAFAADGTDTGNLLVIVFLRGGMDGLHLLAPATSAAYQAARPDIAHTATGNNAALPVGDLDGKELFLHPRATGLLDLYASGDLALIPASGLLSENRSHFESMDMMERGIADGETDANTGWLTRHLSTLGQDLPLLSTVAVGSSNPISLLGYPAPAIASADDFNVWSGPSTLDLLRGMAEGSATGYADATRQTVDAIQEVQSKLTPFNLSGGTDTETDATEPEASYPGGGFSSAMQNLAAMIKGGLGLQTATVDMGGWDHHNNLINEFNGRVTELSDTLAAFWQDVADDRDRITLITMTEFGRRVEQNGSQGTDHGNASVMMALGGAVNGGQIYGAWPGLNAADLTSGGDLEITTDYRAVVMEALAKRTNNPGVTQVFPTVAEDYLDIFVTDGTEAPTTETDEDAEDAAPDPWGGLFG